MGEKSYPVFISHRAVGTRDEPQLLANRTILFGRRDLARSELPSSNSILVWLASEMIASHYLHLR